MFAPDFALEHTLDYRYKRNSTRGGRESGRLVSLPGGCTLLKLLSVIICTRSPRAEYLTRVLKALRSQKLPLDQWELLFVDNASREPLASKWNLSWHPHARHIREDQVGLAFARQRGMREASADLFLFVDDDNLLAPNYLSEALRIGQEWPRLGVWGGTMVPEFEIEPPPHLLPYLPIRQAKEPRWSNIATCSDAMPCGAGMCVRATVGAAYQRYFERSRIQLTDRSGDDLLSGGDTEIAYVACKVGLGIGIFPNLSLTHLLPRERINETYVLRLTEGIHASFALLAFKWQGVTPSSPLFGIGLLRSIANTMSRKKFERRVYLAQLRGILRARSIIVASARLETQPRLE